MPTQLTLAAAMTEARRLAGIRLELTARERHQESAVDALAGMLRQERKALKEIRKQKKAAEDVEEFHRAAHDLEPG